MCACASVWFNTTFIMTVGLVHLQLCQPVRIMRPIVKYIQNACFVFIHIM